MGLRVRWLPVLRSSGSSCCLDCSLEQLPADAGGLSQPSLAWDFLCAKQWCCALTGQSEEGLEAPYPYICTFGKGEHCHRPCPCATLSCMDFSTTDNPSAVLCPQVAFNKLDPTEYCLILSPVTRHFFENCPCCKPLEPYLKLCVS